MLNDKIEPKLDGGAQFEYSADSEIVKISQYEDFK